MSPELKNKNILNNNDEIKIIETNIFSLGIIILKAMNKFENKEIENINI